MISLHVAAVSGPSSRVASRRGITLLEVLISIGILSIGLLSAMALIPAGRSYMVQAELDDRTATLVPGALSTLETFGLFNEDSLEWEHKSTAYTDPEAPAHRPGFRPAEYNASADPTADQPAAKKALDNARWPGAEASNATTAEITDWHPVDPPPLELRLAGSVPNPRPKTVRVTVTIDGKIQGDEQVEPFGDANPWKYPLPPSLFADPPQMEINKSGPQAGEIDLKPRWKDYSFLVEFLDEADGSWKNIGPLTVIPHPDRKPLGNLNPYRHYGRRRWRDHLRGEAAIDLSVAPKDRRNEKPDDAAPLTIPVFDDFVRHGKIRMIRDATERVQGQLWRFREGVQRGPFHIDREFENEEPGTVEITGNRITHYPDELGDLGFWDDESLDPLGATAWVTAEVPPPEDKDFYSIRVEAGQVVTFDWSDMSDDSSRLDRDVFEVGESRLFPVEFRRGSGTWQQLTPFEDSGMASSFAIPNDGTIRTGIALSDDPINLNTVSYNHDFTAWHNFRYLFDLTVTRHDRMIAIDPLMSTHLDRVIGTSGLAGNPNAHPLAFRRRRFADFQQPYMEDPENARAFIIPRLNWRVIADNPNFDAAVAFAERMCRAEDTVALGQPAEQDAAPEQIFSVSRSTPSGPPVVLRRQAAGRMTWMLTAQPEDLGSVASNWHAGKYFDVSVVIFQDRPIPVIGQTQLAGEYAFQSTWDDGDGLLRVNVTPAFAEDEPLDDEEIRRLVGPGSWVLLAPRFTLQTPEPDNRFRLEWLKIRSVQYEKRPNETLVIALLEKEPDENVLLREKQNEYRLRDDAGRYAVTALCYEGVVGVIRRSIQVGPASN